MSAEDAEARQAVAIELRASLAPGWDMVETATRIEVRGPDSAEFVQEVWRLAHFIAYDEFVSIERIPSDSRTYLLRSRSKGGLSFQVLFSAGAAPDRTAPDRVKLS